MCRDIASIRSRWLRRSLAVLWLVVMTPFIVLCEVVDSVCIPAAIEFCSGVLDESLECWRLFVGVWKQ